MSWIQSAFGSRVSPVILFIIVLLAVVFFVAGLLHLLIRFLLKQRSRLQHLNNNPDHAASGAFQRQLQQLFHLHDSGLDQALIDALPVFSYRDLVGSKEPFDCAVCLCEFSEEDKLRLLPLCSHAFHIDCIDTWLLSNSTCPLCRGMILSPGVPFENPVFYFDDSKETEDVSTSNDDNNSSALITEKRVFSVRLGKFKNVVTNCSAQRHHQNEQISEVGETSNSNLDARRCYSMGSFQYVVADLDLQVALCPSRRERRVKGRGVGGGVSRNFAADEEDGVNGGDVIGKRINGGAKGESFSVSKIWLWSKKGTSRFSDEV